MADEKPGFLARWSERKLEAARREVKSVPSAPAQPATDAAALPPPESLGFESDFSAFMRANVADGVKRAALKKLFSAAHFHFDQMDKLDIGIDDYTQGEVLTEDMLAKLEHAKNALFGLRREEGSAVEAKDAVRGDEAAAPPAATREDHDARG